MKTNPYEVEMADVAKELNANIVISYHTATITITNEQLQSMKENNLPTDIMSCVMAGLFMSGMNEEEVQAYLDEANKEKGKLSVSFEAPDGDALNVKSKEENPMLDLLVQTVEQ